MAAIDSWFEEKQSAWLYRLMASSENDANKQVLFSVLADAAENQAQIWAKKISQAGDMLPEFQPNVRGRIVGWLIKHIGPRAVRPVLSAMKVRGLSIYQTQVILPGHPMPTSIEEVGHRHTSVGSGGNLRAAVFGVNDGLVSNTSLIMGVAGASSDVHIIFTSGIAGLLAGALSMAAGEYVSMRSQREMYEYQIGLERDELEEYPKEEAEELALIYNARGMDMAGARRFATELLQDPEHALETLAREELGLNPTDLGSPWGAALFSFFSFTFGALIPLLPFLAGFGIATKNTGITLIVTALLAGVSLFLIGATLSLFTGRKALWSGLRMLIIGAGAGLITFLIGHVLGVSLS